MKKKVWVDAVFIGATIDFFDKELMEISKDIRKIPKNPNVKYNLKNK